MDAPELSELEAIVSAHEATGAPVGQIAAPERSPRLSGDRARGMIEALQRLDGFAELQSAAEAELRRDAEQRRVQADADKAQSAESAGTGAARLAQWAGRHRDFLEERPPEPDGVEPWIPTSTPVTFIRTSPGGALHDFDEVNAWAKWETRLPGPGFTATDTYIGA